MKGYLIVAFLATVVVLSGCSRRPVPLATSYPLTTQQKMQAAHHWDVLADDVAARLKATLEAGFGAPEQFPDIYIPEPDKKRSQFSQTFYHLLTTQLVRRGVSVITNRARPSQGGSGYVDAIAFDNNVMVIDYDIQVIQHNDRRLSYPPPGIYTALAGGVWLVAQAVDTWEKAALAVFPITVGMDINAAADMYLPGETNTEVVITLTATRGQQHFFADTGIYYINTGDSDQYDDTMGKSMRVVNE
ncbi:hypothetical protein [Beggiatoa leptomitoformis]|uniref:Uncharacterized protein n=1 Tax=Beggiatoa leptomitoformis TaxID=288004 RepID=A0A2N9YIH4_9GAMM|nr:hypothetical protein [Beggiatoa leptomitoformis]ALG67495.1 hypothetical protein AL038_07000 [Beggiatoa leptomitoformis]AUI70283.1 hypothetical protein BLE401_17310 [Beggiatoa leptomitoformis]